MIGRLSINKADVRVHYSIDCQINEVLISHDIDDADVINIEESVSMITIWYRS
jgi:hypothetical protein